MVAHVERPTRSGIVRVRGNQEAQARFIADLAPGETLMQGGLGSGKTWGGSRKLLWLHAYNHCPGHLTAPTYGDIHRYMLPAIYAACDELRWRCKLTRGEHQYLTVLGQPIFIISSEQPDRFAGYEVGHGWMDEAARCQQSTEDPLRDAPTQFRTRLRHPRARILHHLYTTTPEGLDTFVQRDFFDKPLPHRRAYIASTLRNAALPPSYIETLKASLPAELIEQYLSGLAVSYIAHRAHPTFTRVRHVADMPWTPGVPVHVGCDYNVSPMGWVALQVVGDEVRVLDEVYLADFATVDSAVHAAHAKRWGHAGQPPGKDPRADRPGFVVFHPDKSSKARSTVGDPEFTVMDQTARALGWNHTGDPYGVNPPVQGRINNLSRLILDATGRARLRVHSRCVHTIEDLERTGRGSNGYDPGAEGKRGHILDALGYACWDIAQPMGRAEASNILNT